MSDAGGAGRTGGTGGKNAAAKDGKRKFTFHFSLTGLICAATVLLLGMVWVFIFGVLVGRGYQPESSVPQLARIMPTAPAARNETTAEAAPAPVLKAEELQFSERLKAKAEAAEPPRAAEKSAAAKTAPAKPAPRTADAAKTAPVEPAAKATASPRAEEAARELPMAGAFVYVYQCAAFRELSMARSLESRIDAKGYNAGVESSDVKGTTWHRVLVHFTGRPEDTAGLKQALRSLGVKKPIMRSKKPI
ncbi:MAG: SPOR domain-containing protein [Desulfovibrionaceae bacterium]|jgi:cell division septation protein DedD|nr:SPOR domain-containing protein [Desulfovibrionaceae bacterium]